MHARVHVQVGLCDLAVATDEEAHARVEFPQAKWHAEGLAPFAVAVGHQRKREAVLASEGGLVCDRIVRDTDNADAGGLVFLPDIAERAGLFGAAGGAGLGVEEDQHGLAAQLLEPHGLAVLIHACEVGRGTSGR